MPPSKPEWIPKRNGGLEHDGVKIFIKTILVLHLLFCDNFEMRTSSGINLLFREKLHQNVAVSSTN